MQAKPGAPPRGYCYRAGSKHAAHGKVTIRGSEAFGRTGGWMEKRCNVTLKSFVGRHPAFIPLMCFLFVDRRKTHARRNRTQAVFECGIKDGISRRQLYCLCSKLCQTKAFATIPVAKAFAIGLVSWRSSTRPAGTLENLCVTGRDGLSTSPTVSICVEGGYSKPSKCAVRTASLIRFPALPPRSCAVTSEHFTFLSHLFRLLKVKR